MMHGGVHCVEGCTLDDTCPLAVSVKTNLLLMSGFLALAERAPVSFATAH